MVGPYDTPRYTWQYDENHQRLKEVRVDNSGTRTNWALHPDNRGGLGFEREDGPTGASNWHYLSVGGQVIGVLVSNAALPTLGANQTAPTVITTTSRWSRWSTGTRTTWGRCRRRPTMRGR